jgi:RNA polymerase sigma-70 factor (ECF subfamily)
MPDDDVEALVRRAAGGDAAAAEALVRRYEGPLRTEVHRRLGPSLRVREDTDDLLQSTLVAVMRGLAGFEYRGEAAFRAWLATVAERQVRMAGRFHRRERRDARREEGVAATGGPPDARTSPSAGAVRGEATAGLRAAVAALPEEERRAVELHTFQGLGFPEVAARMGLADKDAARYVFRKALKRLGDLLDGGS